MDPKLTLPYVQPGKPEPSIGNHDNSAYTYWVTQLNTSTIILSTSTQPKEATFALKEVFVKQKRNSKFDPTQTKQV